MSELGLTIDDPEKSAEGAIRIFLDYISSDLRKEITEDQVFRASYLCHDKIPAWLLDMLGKPKDSAIERFSPQQQ